MKCPKCGAPMKKKDMFCGNCGEKKSSKSHRSRASFIFIIVFVLVFFSGLVLIEIKFDFLSSIIRAKEIKNEATKIVEYISAGNQENIQQIIFPEAEPYVYADNGIKPPTTSEGAFFKVIENTKITLNEINFWTKTVTYTVEASDMSSFLQDYIVDGADENMSNFLSRYMSENTKRKETKVAVRYSLSEHLKFDYSTPEFLDALTGGLLSSYDQLYFDTVASVLEGSRKYNES